jgi:hypothetical protein
MIGSRRRSMILGRDPARGQLAGIAAAAVFVACVALAVALVAAARRAQSKARAYPAHTRLGGRRSGVVCSPHVPRIGPIPSG